MADQKEMKRKRDNASVTKKPKKKEKLIVKKYHNAKVVVRKDTVPAPKKDTVFEDRIVNSYLIEKQRKERAKKSQEQNQKKMALISEASKKKKEEAKAKEEKKAAFLAKRRAEPSTDKAKAIVKRIEEEKAKKQEIYKKKKEVREAKRAELNKKKEAKKAKAAAKKPDAKKPKVSKLDNMRKYYPAQPVNFKPKTKVHPKAAKLRKSIHPGQVLIVVRGPHRGRRVVFLKQLESGLLLVTGPYCINKVPLRRLNQRYVIATSTRLDISGISIPAKFTDSYFQRPFAMRRLRRRMWKKFFRVNSVRRYRNRKSYYVAIRQHRKNRKWTLPRTVTKTKKIDQKKMDIKMLSIIRKRPMMRSYLKSYFTLTNGQYPHAMKF